MYSLSDYDYHLPDELIAQQPVPERGQSRLLCLDHQTGGVTHNRFQDLYDLLEPPDTLVVNDTEVVPGRLIGKKKTGGKAELLIVDYAGRKRTQDVNSRVICKCLIKTSKRPKQGSSLTFKNGLTAEVLGVENGVFTVAFSPGDGFDALLYQIGETPLPPYIKRNGQQADSRDDRTAYQTVYAARKGAVAAPTAGLHFSKAYLGRLKSKGIRIVHITLHVGYGTFMPVRASDIRDHRMHGEWFSVSEAAADSINRAKSAGGRIVAVGTTSVRTLEYSADTMGQTTPGCGICDLYIYPGYRFKSVDAMLTNFHLPKSTLLILVSAFAGREAILNAYRTAVEQRYRFFSYGDAMFIA